MMAKKKAKRIIKTEFSKLAVSDTRKLIWFITVSGMILAFYCVHKGYTGSLPWVATLVGLPWAAYGSICDFYLNMAKSDHKVGGVTFEAAKAENFGVESTDSPPI